MSDYSLFCFKDVKVKTLKTPGRFCSFYRIAGSTPWPQFQVSNIRERNYIVTYGNTHPLIQMLIRTFALSIKFFGPFILVKTSKFRIFRTLVNQNKSPGSLRVRIKECVLQYRGLCRGIQIARTLKGVVYSNCDLCFQNQNLA